MWNKTVDLSNVEPLFVGGERLVYQDPRFNDCLIKLPRFNNGRENKIKNRNVKRYSKWRYGVMRSWFKEQEEYLALLWREQKVPNFIAGFYGYCDTSEGPGMVVEKITDVEGRVAKTVAAIKTSLSKDEAELLLVLIDDFFDKMIEFNCVAKDLHMANVAVSGDFSRLVLIDGLGDGVLIKLKKYSRTLRENDMNKKRKRFKEYIQS
jgi:hypothetical protein